ncbi:MAG: hypothetical protein QOE70_6086 [Chthoniobacter sp.]|nr:hypothetical protein [Chthoniobacter sp.]
MKIPHLPLPLVYCSAIAFALAAPAPAARVVAIGDSLTAEYDTIPSIPGFSSEATAYAEVTVPGWESMSWVEVLSRVQRKNFDFGGNKKLPDIWSIPRLSGYEYNWGIPGIEAGQYEDFVTSSVWSNFAYFALRQPLEDQLKNRVQRVVIWLGANEFRAHYGALYDGGDSKRLIDGLISDLGRIVDFTKKKNSKLQIVLANVPDLGATPSKKAAHPDPQKRARVTAATKAANARIAQLAVKKGVALVDVYAQTARFVQGVPVFFGAVQIISDQDSDNDPHYAFTRDGLHPNTAAQILNARAIIDAFNQRFAAGLPQITDAQALTLLGINPNEPFYDWLASYGLTNKSFIADLDLDGLTQLVEFAFGLNPTQPDADQLPVTIGGPVPGIAGAVSIHYQPDPLRKGSVRVQAQYSLDQLVWKNVPAKNVITHSDGSFTAVTPTNSQPHLRLLVSTIPPSGSTVSVSSILSFD